MTQKPSYVYIGRKLCGCAVAVTTYSWKDRHEVAKCVADMIRHGELVYLYTWDEYLALDIKLGCDCGKQVSGDALQRRML